MDIGFFNREGMRVGIINNQDVILCCNQRLEDMSYEIKLKIVLSDTNEQILFNSASFSDNEVPEFPVDIIRYSPNVKDNSILIIGNQK